MRNVSSRSRAGRAETKRAGFRGAWAVALLVPLAGCDAWRGPIRSDLEARISQQLSAVRPVALESLSRTQPVSAEAAQRDFVARPPAAATQPAIPATSQPVSQQDRRQLDLAGLRAGVLRNNLDLQVVLLEPAIARTRVSEAEARFDATIRVFAERRYEDLPVIDDELVPQQRPAQVNRIFNYDAGVNIPLPTGGTMQLSAPQRKKSLDDPQKKGQYLSAAKFSLSQPLLRDAGIDVNVAPIRLARYAAAAVDTRTTLQSIRVLAQAEKAYWRVYGGWRELEIRREQYAQAVKNLDIVRVRVARGQSAGIEEIRAELGVSERLERLIVADTDLKVVQRNLRVALNDVDLSVNSPVLIVPTTEPNLLHYRFEYDELIRRALDNRLELLELELQLAADAVTIDFARNQTLPLFVLDYEYEFLDRGKGFGDALETNMKFDRGSWRVALRGELPVTNEARKSQLRRALLTRVQRLATREQRTLAVRQEVSDAADVLEQNWQRILAARQNVIGAQVNYAAELRQFDDGLRTQTEVLEALTRLGDAQSRELRAIVDYQISQIDLAFATGTLLGYSRVGLEPVLLSESSSPVRADQR